MAAFQQDHQEAALGAAIRRVLLLFGAQSWAYHNVRDVTAPAVLAVQAARAYAELRAADPDGSSPALAEVLAAFERAATDAEAARGPWADGVQRELSQPI
jgi:hypothetical protein